MPISVPPPRIILYRFFFYNFFFLVLVLISVKTGLSLWPWASVVVVLRVEIALHDILTYRLRVPDGVGRWEPAPNCGGRGGAVPIRGGQYVPKSGRLG